MLKLKIEYNTWNQLQKLEEEKHAIYAKIKCLKTKHNLSVYFVITLIVYNVNKKETTQQEHQV